jgi:osmoprotectant transport system permease protein
VKDIIDFTVKRQDKILELLVAHIEMVLTALFISVIIGVIVGYLITYNKKVANVVLYVCSMLMTIPSLALFTFFIPILGIGQKPAIAGLVIYTLLPIVRNVYVGLTNIDPAITSSARGMGMTEFKITVKIKIPLALPVVFAGIRTAAVMGIGLGAIAAYIGGGGLGQYIFQGINRSNRTMIIIGAVLISVISIIVDKIMQILQKRTENIVN